MIVSPQVSFVFLLCKHLELYEQSFIVCCTVREILVRRKFWAGGPKFLENWSAGPLFSENFGPRVELWSERKYFGVSTFNDTRLCQSVCIVSRIPRK